MRVEKQKKWRPTDWQLVIYAVSIGVIIILEFMLGKAGWFILPVALVLLYLARERIQKINPEKQDVIRIRSVKPRRDSLR